MTVKDFKKELARVFDDNLHTKQWHNYVDYVIIFLILLSTAEIFISTFPISPSAEKWMKGIDWFTQIFFTIEVSLRIWTADELDPKYKGFWGRVRYCFSFYGLIDFLATYPFWINYLISLPVAALKSIRILRLFRIARIFRIFRYMKAFRFLGTAIRSKKNEMVISLQFLTIVTVVLSFILYFVEHEANPEMIGNGWESFVWAFAKYIGDPGKVADEPIVTVAGQVISFIVGILGIAIFAVPIGLIGSGFTEAIEEEEKQAELERNIEKLHNAFERKADRPTGYQVVPMFLSVTDVQARMKMTESAIFEAAEAAGNFRIFNIASTIPAEKNPMDRLAIEHFVVNRPYGCYIDRGSKVTIVSPSSVVDAMVGNWAYYLAKIGGFNYISRECGQASPYQSYYLQATQDIPGLQEFMDDLNHLLDREGAWSITILAAAGAQEPSYPEQVHIGYGGKKGDSTFDGEDLFVKDFEKADEVFSALEKMLQNDYDIASERQQRYRYDNHKVYLRHLEKAENGFILRIAWSAFAWNPKRIQLAESMAEIFHNCLDADHEIDRIELKTKDIGYKEYSA